MTILKRGVMEDCVRQKASGVLSFQEGVIKWGFYRQTSDKWNWKYFALRGKMHLSPLEEAASLCFPQSATSVTASIESRRKKRCQILASILNLSVLSYLYNLVKSFAPSRVPDTAH